MRKVEAQMIMAIRDLLNRADHDGRAMFTGNTEVLQCHHGVAKTPGYQREISVLLHGNEIATIWPDVMQMKISDCGWQSATTKSRLNALLGAFTGRGGITQSRYVWTINGVSWQGSARIGINFDADRFQLRQAEVIAGAKR